MAGDPALLGSLKDIMVRCQEFRAGRMHARTFSKGQFQYMTFVRIALRLATGVTYV